MADFTVNGIACKSGKMDLWAQMHVQRRIAVAYPALAGAVKIFKADPILASGYVTQALSRLSNEDWDFIVNNSLDQVQVLQKEHWVPLKTKGQNTLQFPNIALPDLYLIIFNVLFDHYAPFIDALPSLVSAVMDLLKKA